VPDGNLRALRPSLESWKADGNGQAVHEGCSRECWDDALQWQIFDKPPT